MKARKNLLIVGLGSLLAICAVGYWITRGSAPVRPSKQPPALVDASLMKTARRLAALADTNDEQDQAREALRLADHELDLAFATALRQADAPDAKAGLSGPLQQLSVRIAELKAKIASETSQIAELTKQDQLGLAKAQLELDQDDLDDAQQDLARQGGDRHNRLEQALQRRQAAQQAAAALPKPAAPPPADTLKDQWSQWSALRAKNAALVAAQQQAADKAAALLREHNQLESQTEEAAPSGADVALLRKLSDQKKTLTEFDKRVQDSQQLAAAYQLWMELVEARQQGMLHLVLRSLLTILAVVLVLVLAHRFIVRTFGGKDRRTRHLVEVASEIGCQLIGVGVILLMAFGPPTQLSTLLGLATAGLTVVLKDFIVGFIGWFVLMGRNGVRIGDWVEINGVGGEVIEIGVFKTVLLEMGNWTNTGHPTGRTVSFSNGYAIEGHYFNFSTVGQWLWDEIQVTVPPKGDPYQMAEQIRQTVERATEAAAAEAEQDWERVTHEYGVSKFSARPAVDIRPGLQGLDVVVRYITRAPQRYEVKSQLFKSIVSLLHTGAPAESH